MKCEICGSESLGFTTAFNVMLECPNCFVQYPVTLPLSGVMTNNGVESDPEKVSLLNIEQIRIVKRLNPAQIIDFGSGNGQFLFHAQKACRVSNNNYGVELDLKSVRQAKKYGLRVLQDIESLDFGCVVTFWHSLEHLSARQVKDLLSRLSKVQNLKLVIAVPNGQSIAWKKFGLNFPYYDQDAHFLQFSPDSLELLLRATGFEIESKKTVLSYSIFNVLQTIINLDFPRNKFYDALKRGNGVIQFWDWIRAIFCLLRNFHHLFRLFLAELSFKDRGVLVVVARSTFSGSQQ